MTARVITIRDHKPDGGGYRWLWLAVDLDDDGEPLGEACMSSHRMATREDAIDHARAVGQAILDAIDEGRVDFEDKDKREKPA